MKKLFSMILVLAMLCTMLALASCGDDTTETSSEATSSEESVAPPTNAELFEAALESLDTTYLPAFANVFSIDLSKFESETGNANVLLSLDELSAMGENMFGEDPLKIGMELAIGKEAGHANGILYAAGDEVKLEMYTKGDKQYISFPELYEDTFFDMADMNGEDVEIEAEDNAFDFASAIDKIVSLLLKEENITISEDGKIFTVTMGKEDTQAFFDIFEPLLGIADGMDDISGLSTEDNSDTAEMPEPDSLVLVLNLSSDTQASMNYTIKEGETVVSETNATFASLGGMTTITFKSNALDNEVFDITLSATESAVSVEGDMNLAGTLIELEMDVTNENDACTIDGTLSLSIDMSGMLLTIPFELDGSFAVEGETLSMAMSMSASIEGMMNIGLSVEMDYTPGDVTVTLPFAESDVAEFDAEDFNTKMAEVYPNASALLNGASGDEPGDVSYVTYANESQSLIFNIYTDGTVELVFYELTYEKTDDTLTFYKGEDAIYSLGYTVDEDGNYVVYGEAYATSTGDPALGEYLVNFYSYYADGTFLDVYLYDENVAELSMCYFYDPESTTLLLTLPDGNTVSYDFEMSEDGMTVTLFGETLNMVMEAANF